MLGLNKVKYTVDLKRIGNLIGLLFFFHSFFSFSCLISHFLFFFKKKDALETPAAVSSEQYSNLIVNFDRNSPPVQLSISPPLLSPSTYIGGNNSFEPLTEQNVRIFNNLNSNENDPNNPENLGAAGAGGAVGGSPFGEDDKDMYSHAITQHLGIDLEEGVSDDMSDSGTGSSTSVAGGGGGGGGTSAAVAGNKFFKFDWKRKAVAMTTPTPGGRPLKTPITVQADIEDEGPPIALARNKSFGSLGSDISTISSISSLSSDEE